VYANIIEKYRHTICWVTGALLAFFFKCVYSKNIIEYSMTSQQVSDAIAQLEQFIIIIILLLSQDVIYYLDRARCGGQRLDTYICGGPQTVTSPLGDDTCVTY